LVHVFCLDDKCRRVVHLDDSSYWNYKGRVKCKNCGAEMEVEIKNGEIISCKKVKMS